MIYLAKIQQDTTIYEASYLINAGDDSILELNKDTFENIENSRILVQFDINEISRSIASGEIGANPQYHLRCYATNPSGLPLQYTLQSYIVSGSWTSGTNELYDTVDTDLDVNWEFVNSTAKWLTGSYAAETTASWTSYPGGGTWYTGSVATQSFDYETADLNLNVTPFIEAWLTGSYANNGLIIKRTDEAETLEYVSNIKWFAKDTNTIYSPVLEIRWDDAITSSSIDEVDGNDIVVNASNLKEIYSKDSRARIRLAPRPKYPSKTFSTQSSYRTPYILSYSSSYSIVDSVTRESIIPFDDIYTRLSADDEGSYFDLRMSNFPEERWFELKVKTKTTYGEENYNIGSFKVNR